MKLAFDQQPQLRLLTDEQVQLLHEKALYILERTGVMFRSGEALRILKEHGAEVDFDRSIVRFEPQMVMDALDHAPSCIQLYDREGQPAAVLGGQTSHFNPGSAAIEFVESDGITVRQALARDQVMISRLTDALDNIALQSTSVVPSDAPEAIGDSYRLYLSLKTSPKAVITGAFSIHGIEHMRDILAAVSGGIDALRRKPKAVFDVCPSPALKWTTISCRNIIDCARDGLPIESVSMPMPGATTPVTLAGSVLVHTAETLSGLVLSQVVNPGTPFVYGGAPVHFDMRTGVTPLGAVEATMIGAAYAQMGKYYGLPTHTYACLGDSRMIDAQAGLETAMSGILAQLAGINVISGPGMLDCVRCMSLEKLVIDNEICGMALRLHRGINCAPDALAAELIADLGPGGDYLSTQHTLEWFRREQYIPSPVIDRSDRSSWEAGGSRDILSRARDRVKDILEGHEPVALDAQREDALDDVLRGIMAEMSITTLPVGADL